MEVTLNAQNVVIDGNKVNDLDKIELVRLTSSVKRYR